MQPVAAHAVGEAVPPWTCRECSARTGRSYGYPDCADSYCITCGGAMSDVERLATLVKALLRAPVLAAVPATCQVPLREFLTVEEVALLLRTTPGGIRARAARGRLPGLVRVGRRLLVRRDALLRSLERRASSPGRSR
jgi:excisionase family DNA binding protein